MLPIERKTTGFLIDEWITSKFKVEDGVEGATQRNVGLSDAIATRMKSVSVSGHKALDELIDKLHLVSRECWDAQDKICLLDYQHPRIGVWAKLAQDTNAKRTALIRKIDSVLGEEGVTALEKTYKE